MGTDIHSYAEVRRDGVWHLNTEAVFHNAYHDCGESEFIAEPFAWRGYGMFSLFGWTVKDDVVPLAEDRGMPDDVSTEVFNKLDGPVMQRNAGAFFYDQTVMGHSWFTLAELQAVDPARSHNGKPDGEPLVEYLGEGFFEQIDDLAKLGKPEDVRVVFAFSN